jgi:hypothetical protein
MWRFPVRVRVRQLNKQKMEIKKGKGSSEFGPGVEINLSGNELATAIDAYLVAHGIIIVGPRTIRVNGEMCESSSIYVDPSGYVNTDSGTIYGRTGNYTNTQE